ncbi:MAG TPA: ABC transporter permease subunit [bacterium]|nr:ABC transporter permease subunit [bacterium]
MSQAAPTSSRPIARRRGRTGDGPAWWVYAIVGLFALLVAGIFLSAFLNSIASTWFGGWLPDAYTAKWYQFALAEFDLGSVLAVTIVVGLSVTLISLALGVPAAYALARHVFPGRAALMLLLVLPMMVPPITYGIPLAAMLYKLHLGGKLAGVIVANVVPALPFVVLIMTPFFEQIDPNLERAARTLGAPALRVFARVLLPIALPGMLAAGLLILVRAIALFELTFLVSGAKSQTLVVALYYTAFAAGIRPSQAIDAMAVVYMVTGLVLLLAALRFINPVNMVIRVRR